MSAPSYLPGVKIPWPKGCLKKVFGGTCTNHSCWMSLCSKSARRSTRSEPGTPAIADQDCVAIDYLLAGRNCFAMLVVQDRLMSVLPPPRFARTASRSEEHTSELQS